MRLPEWQIGPPDRFGCCLWLGKLNDKGYPTIWRDGFPARAHRALWEQLEGPIPEGMEIEHRCRRRSCLARAHLKLVTRSMNERLKSWRARVRADICDAKHDAMQAMVTPEGGRVCRICSRTPQG